MLVPYRTLAKPAADKISVLSYALVESASGYPESDLYTEQSGLLTMQP